MAACPSCGADNRGGARFCDACGARLDEVASPDSQVRKTVTVLFADVTGSTALRERSDRGAVRALMGPFGGAGAGDARET
jgi:class 3 adenylate cyclase